MELQGDFRCRPLDGLVEEERRDNLPPKARDIIPPELLDGDIGGDLGGTVLWLSLVRDLTPGRKQKK